MIAIAFVQHFIHVTMQAPTVLYIGPDVFLPITSALAAIAGVLLMFWQRVVGLVGRLFGRSTKQGPADPPQPTPRD